MNLEVTRPQLLKSNIQQISKLFLAKKYDSCLKLIEESLKTWDDVTQLRILQASCWTQLGINFEEAEYQLNEVIQKEPDNGFAYYGLGLSYYFLGDFSKCIAPFTRASELNEATTDRASIFKNYAMKVLKLVRDASEEFKAGRCSKALEMLSLATLIDPDNAAIKRLVQQESDKFLKKVVGDLEDKVLADNDMETILNHVTFLVKSGKIAAADDMIPKDEMLSTSRGWYLKGFIKYMMGSVKMSLFYTKKALVMDTTMDEAKDLKNKAEKLVELIEGATGQMKQNDNEKAIEMLTEALDVDDSNKRIVQAIYFQRAVAKFNSGKQHEAFNDYLLFEALQNVTGMVMEGLKF